MLLNNSQYTGLPLTTKNDLVPKASRPRPGLPAPSHEGSALWFLPATISAPHCELIPFPKRRELVSAPERAAAATRGRPYAQ